MDLQCPKCEHELVRSGELKRRCESCNNDFKIRITCSTCGDEIERLKACGAVSFWCNECNEMKSKSSAVYSLQNDD